MLNREICFDVTVLSKKLEPCVWCWAVADNSEQLNLSNELSIYAASIRTYIWTQRWVIFFQAYGDQKLEAHILQLLL